MIRFIVLYLFIFFLSCNSDDIIKRDEYVLLMPSLISVNNYTSVDFEVKNNILEKVKILDNDNLRFVICFFYENNKISSVRYLDSNDSVVNQTDFYYLGDSVIVKDEKGTNEASIYLDEVDGDLKIVYSNDSVCVCQLDDFGNLKRKEIFFKGSKIDEYVYFYDTNKGVFSELDIPVWFSAFYQGVNDRYYFVNNSVKAYRNGLCAYHDSIYYSHCYPILINQNIYEGKFCSFRVNYSLK